MTVCTITVNNDVYEWLRESCEWQEAHHKRGYLTFRWCFYPDGSLTRGSRDHKHGDLVTASFDRKTARKRHSCTNCGGAIAAGSEYWDSGPYKLCLICEVIAA